MPWPTVVTSAVTAVASRRVPLERVDVVGAHVEQHQRRPVGREPAPGAEVPRHEVDVLRTGGDLDTPAAERDSPHVGRAVLIKDGLAVGGPGLPPDSGCAGGNDL